MSTGQDFLHSYRELLRDVLAAGSVPGVRDPTSVGSDFGKEDRPFREVLGGNLVVSGDEVLLRSATRPVDPTYAVLSSMWTILGRNDLAPLQEVNPRGAAFSADGYTLSGAFGHRMRSEGPDQLEAALSLLRSDPTTRRATCVIARPEDTSGGLRDVPCATSLQLLARGGALHGVVTMRSQSAFGVLPYDVVNFSHLLSHLAWRAGLEHGDLHLQFGSLHVYEAEVGRVQAFLSETGARAVALPPLEHERLEEAYAEWTHPRTGAAVREAYLDAHSLSAPDRT